MEIIQGTAPNQISIFRQVLACFSVTINGASQFLLIGQDLRVLPKKTYSPIRREETDFTKLAQLMPYKMFSFNSRCPMICFNVEDVSRPSCFVSVKNGENNLLRIRGSGTMPVPHESLPQFWGFPLTFCDRSLYAAVSIGETENNEAIRNGLQPYIVSDLNLSDLVVPLNTNGGGEDSGDEDIDSDSDIDHLPISYE